MIQDNKDNPVCYKIEFRRKVLEQITEMVELDGSSGIPETIKNAISHYWDYLHKQAPKGGGEPKPERPKLRLVHGGEP
jgi:hypothetical protein